VRAALCRKKREIGVRVLCWTSRALAFIRRARITLKTVATIYQQSTKAAAHILFIIMLSVSYYDDWKHTAIAPDPRGRK
jgi:hypothetical protein